MKKLLICVIIMSLAGLMQAQSDTIVVLPYTNEYYTKEYPAYRNSSPQNTVYISFAPVDLGVGIRYDRQFAGKGLYTSLHYGNYKFPGGYIDDHYKIALGGIVYHNDILFTAGGSWHWYGEHKIPIDMDTRTFQRFSCEIGMGAVFEKVVVAVRIDVIKWESNLELGWRF